MNTVGYDLAVPGVRATIPAGTITKGQLINVQPFGNELRLAKATGQDILDALELDVSALPAASGSLLQVSGLSCQTVLDVPSSVQANEAGRSSRFPASAAPTDTASTSAQKAGAGQNASTMARLPQAGDRNLAALASFVVLAAASAWIVLCRIKPQS